MLWFVVVMKIIGTKMVHVCEGTVKCPVEWSKFCDLVVCYGLLE